MTNLRNNDFEEFKRTHPNVKEIATVWRGSSEDVSWRELYLQEGQNFEYIENEQVVTFYRVMTDKEVSKAAEKKEEAVEESKFYQELGVTHEHYDANESHRVTWVKLANSRKGRVDDRWAEVEYVLVDQYSKVDEIEGVGQFTYTETQIRISDDNKTDYTEQGLAVPIYVAPGWLEPWQALWAIGEVASQDKESN